MGARGSMDTIVLSSFWSTLLQLKRYSLSPKDHLLKLLHVTVLLSTQHCETDSAVISLMDLFFNDPLRDGSKQDSSLAASALRSSSLSFHTSYFCRHPVFPLPPITTCLPLLPPPSPFPPSPPLQWIGLGSGPLGQWSKWQLWQGPDFTLAPSVTCLAAGLILIM